MRQLPWAYRQVTQHTCKRGAGDSGGAGVRATMGLVERKREVYSSRKRAWSGVQKRKWPSPPRDFWFLHPRLGLNPVKKKMPSRWQHQITGVKQGCKALWRTLHCAFLGGISFSHQWVAPYKEVSIEFIFVFPAPSTVPGTFCVYLLIEWIK